MERVRCCVEVEAGYARKARYALEELLRPLGVVPAWCARDEVGTGLYYGAAPPEGALPLPWDARAAEAFARGRPTGDPAEAEPADPVAAAFFWLAGWPEVHTLARDAHGRFPFAVSLQAARGTACVPVVDRLRSLLAQRLERAGFPVRRTRWAGRTWAVAPTFDVDRTRTRRAGVLWRAVRRPTRPALRAVLASDPVRAGLAGLAAHAPGATVFLKAAARGPWDVPYALDGRLRRWADALRRQGAELALHPSYHAVDHLGHLRAERDRLTRFLGVAPTTARLHFLRFDPLRTPPLLHAAGLRVEATLGFAEHEGFRRGTAHPFRLYDLLADTPLELWEVPLAVMDVTLFQYRRLGPEAAEAAAWRVLDAARDAGGCAVLLWHPEYAALHPEGAAVLHRLLARAEAAGAARLTLADAVRYARAEPPGSAEPLTD